eukprot:6334964-Heterocapsa_arctica.AAC.1
MRESHRLGFGYHFSKEITVLNRVVTLGHDGGHDGGRRYEQLEPDTRHVHLIIRSMGLECAKAKPAATPRVKKSDEHEERRRDEPVLGRQDTTLYRSN